MHKVAVIFCISLLSMIFSISCVNKDLKQGVGSSSEKDTIQGMPQIEFVVEAHDFGKIIQGEVVSFTFFYENVGSGGLLITSASATCGCTIPNYSKEPLASGSRGKLEVVFDSKGKMGAQNKSIAIRTNGTPVRKVLNIQAEVISNIN